MTQGWPPSCTTRHDDGCDPTPAATPDMSRGASPADSSRAAAASRQNMFFVARSRTVFTCGRFETLPARPGLHPAHCELQKGSPGESNGVQPAVFAQKCRCLVSHSDMGETKCATRS